MHKDPVGQGFGQSIMGPVCLRSTVWGPHLEDSKAGAGVI